MHPDVMILVVVRVIAWMIAIGSFVVSIAVMTNAHPDVVGQLTVSNSLLFSISALVFLIATKGATRSERLGE